MDTTAVNGTTYYYKVSAENANGEGQLSNEASATPADLVPPDAPLPTVDSFDRANENPLAGGWTNGISSTGGVETGLFITANTLACSKTTTCTAWRNTGQYGPDAESWARLSTLPGTGNAIRLYVRIQQPGSSAYDGYMLRTSQLAGTDQVFIDRIDNSAVVNRLTVNQELAAGDVLLLRAKGTLLEAWRNDGSGWSRLGVVNDPTYSRSRLHRHRHPRHDRAARRLRCAEPQPEPAPWRPPRSAPSPDAGSVSLSWTAPSFDGGLPITNYRVYRGTSSGQRDLPANAGTSTTYVDSTAVNGTTYYYKVSAENAQRRRTALNEASATPPTSCHPRAASDRGRLQPPEREPASDRRLDERHHRTGGSRRASSHPNTLACSKSTTCTAWRNTGQYGPDTGVVGATSTLPGTGNASGCTCASSSLVARPTTATCCGRTSSRAPTRSSSIASTTAPSSTG